jgi:hypothetical protein
MTMILRLYGIISKPAVTILKLDATKRAATLRAIEISGQAESKFGCCFFASKAKTRESA